MANTSSTEDEGILTPNVSGIVTPIKSTGLSLALGNASIYEEMEAIADQILH